MTKKGTILTIILICLLIAIGVIIYKENKIIYVNNQKSGEEITANEKENT